MSLVFKLLLHYCFIVFDLNLFIEVNYAYTSHFEGIVIFLGWYRYSASAATQIQVSELVSGILETVLDHF